MKKSDAIEKLGGTATAAAEKIGITPQAVSQWPDELPARIADRVYAAMARMESGVSKPAPEELPATPKEPT